MKTNPLLNAFIPVVALHFSKPKSPEPDPSIGADRKKREAEAQRERVEQAKTRAKQAGGKRARKSLFSGGMTGFTRMPAAQEDKSTTLG